MIRNYFKIAFRNLTKHKLFSLINIGGLSVGMAVSFMLLLYVYNEFSFDKMYKNEDRIYQVWRNQPSNGEIKTGNSMSVPVAEAIHKNYPEIAFTARTNWINSSLFNYKDKSLNLNMLSADPSLLDIFSFEFVQGNKASAFTEVSSVVLTQSGAKAIFGNADPMGKTVKINSARNAKVTGIIKDMPENSSMKFSALGSWAMLEADEPWIKTSSWNNYAFQTFVMVKPGIDLNKVNGKLSGFMAKYNPGGKENKLFLYQFSKQHLYGEFKNGVSTGGGVIEYVRLFMFLAIGILLIACINFMNLSTARSETRAREVGVRKVVGARRISIIQQFMGESLLMCVISFGLALVLVILLLPYFNGIISKNLTVPYSAPFFWIAGLSITLITGIISGSYPALFLSSFKPVKVLKGINKAGKATLRPRQILVIVQFSFATCLILSTILIYKQLNFIKNRPAGYNKSGLVEIPLDGRLYNEFESFRRDAIASGAISDAASTSNTITGNGGASWGIKWPGQLPGEDKLPIEQIVTNYHFTSTYGLKLVDGRDFDIARPSDSTAIMINEAAVKMMRLKEPLGAIINWQGADRTVVGILKNYIVNSPTDAEKPLIVGNLKGWAGMAGVRLNKALPLSEALNKLTAVYKKYNPDYPFDYKFVDEEYSRKFRTEQLLGTLSNSFTVLAIVLSCLGLFGLASFSAEQRRKEIGIRKVLGATTANLWFNLSKEFVQLVIIAFIIGGAVSWHFMDQWLHKYTYRTDISPWVFVATIVISLAITIVTVSWQAIKAALSNPVKSLRSE
ncbi:MAG: FtsX-like permease family protein [Mucilaginibacter sp.]|jgi:ABC-type antimicrobial peptide transport system permease subunit|uniref:FtsX-like permease family protein n=1 Tax=Mucilaginibacter sp. TaxID=1882438 RepID=UPI003569383B